MNYAVLRRFTSDTGDVCDMVELVDFPKIVYEDLFVDICLFNLMLLVTVETMQHWQCKIWLTLLTS